MKILLVEDERKNADYLKQGLSEAGFNVSLARNGLEGLHLAVEDNFDIAIFDIMLPGLDGWQLLQTIRQQGKQWPVLLLTARDQIEDRVKGLELGADDYLIKPFAFAELLARVRALSRRRNSVIQKKLNCFDLEMDLVGHQVIRNQKRVDLTAKEFSLLELLLRRQGEVLPRTLIASQVWDMNFDSDTNVVEVAIRRLRVKIDDPFDHHLIQTVRGMGYMLKAPNTLEKLR